MKLETKCFLVLAIALCFVIKDSAGDGGVFKDEDYSAFDSASWAVTSTKLSTILGTDKQGLYDNFIMGCDAAIESAKGVKNACARNDDHRVQMNTYQPASVYNYTDNGYAKIRVPDDLYKAIREFFDANKHKAEIEWKENNVYHNMWDSPPTFIHLQKSPGLTKRIENEVKPILEDWTGQKLRPVSTYGIRLYHNDSILTPHVDRFPLVTSVIINVDQDIDEPWPLEVYGHDGSASNVTMEPGDMVLYESHSVIHGRPFPMRGNYFANCFIHFEPVEPLEGESLYNPDWDIPPYIIRGSKWEAEWQKSNPQGWKRTVDDIKKIAVHGTVEELETFILKHPTQMHRKDKNGWTVLHEATRKGRTDIVQSLLNHGVDKDLLNKAGQSPLTLARHYLEPGHELIEYLESIGAKDPMRTNLRKSAKDDDSEDDDEEAEEL